MRSRTTRRFRQALSKLPPQTRQQAKAAYRLFAHDPYHPGLHSKQAHPVAPIYSVRVSADYRAVGIREGDEIVWFWIGSHAEYEKLISHF